ncbi:hypothetical protein E3T34_01040 [Cryobacterium sp. TMT1-62]|uniref:metallophosphoesterase n=1 Tax=Cryobacterium sp. TMT1-62 TaxID=1259240 RepID=UPI0010692A08|nr:metallophosphoesterase [Cryobacterium sp. TMT1-62]TFD36288.1 hypothetical protein E3T34_01040 [Cryobacterium sp. TMT1-62]
MSLLQIGDVHYPTFMGQWTSVDNKDKGTTGGIPGHFSKPIASIIAREISKEVSSGAIAAIVICGDLTDRGDLGGFDQATEYLETAIGVGETIPPESVHLLPGNHDVDLADEMAFTDLTSKRFDVLESRLLLEKSVLSLTKDFRISTHASGNALITVGSLNSTKANGAPRLFPSITVDDPVAELLRSVDPHGILTDSKSLVAKVTVTSPSMSIQEILDIPMIDPNDLDEIEDSSSSNQSGLMVVAAHHGFLPQATPRFGPYTEMINGGQVRRRLLALSRPVLYLHGHIHEESLETIRGSGSNAGVDGPPIVAIAAPLLSEGFNRIVVEFGAHGRVLGLLLYRIRVDRGTGGLVSSVPIRIPLAARKTIPVHLRAFFSTLMEYRASSGGDLIRLGAEARFSLSADEVETATVEAAWSGLIELDSDPADSFVEQEYSFR